jgi:hypothetical protein
MTNPNLFFDGPFFAKIVIDPRYGVEDIAAVTDTVIKLIYTETNLDRPGMLLGKIQSGKTKTFIAIIALAFDNGFDGAIILTKGTKALSKQTIERISKEFGEFSQREMLQSFDVMTMPSKLTGYEIEQKLVLVSKKQPDNISRLIEFFSNPILSSKKILIIDDEADYASVGFKKTKDEGIDINTTSKQINELRRLIKSSSFLQVTATPYSLYLQPEEIEIQGVDFKPIRPAFTSLVPVNSQYIGGDYYFNESVEIDSVASLLYVPITREELEVIQKPDRRRFKIEDVLTSKSIEALRSAIVSFIIGGCIRRLQDQKEGISPSKYSFLIHTEAQKNAHAWQEDIVITLFDQLNESIIKSPLLIDRLFKAAYEDMSQSISLAKAFLPKYDEVRNLGIKALTDEWLMITKVNSEKQIEELLDGDGQLKLRTPLNIFIGGQILDRGITISNLIGFFYGRRPKIYQQDTVLQHSRMYGFRAKADLAVTRFYTEPTIYQAMKAMHECDSELRKSFEDISGDQSVVFIRKDDSGLVRACSPNKVLLSKVTTLKSHKRILPIGFQTNYASYLKSPIFGIDKFVDSKYHNLNKLDPILITLDEAIECIKNIEKTLIFNDDGYSFNWDDLVSMLRYLSNVSDSSVNRNKIWLMVRTDRNLNRFKSGGLHSRFSDAPDTAQTDGVLAKETAIDIPLLLLIKQNGSEADGWRGHPFYWPVVYAPKKIKTVIFSSETIDD